MVPEADIRWWWEHFSTPSGNHVVPGPVHSLLGFIFLCLVKELNYGINMVPSGSIIRCKA